MKTIVIAEAGVNHNGDMATAKKLIEAAASAGADIVKFQSFKAEKLAIKNAMKADYQITTTGKTESQFDMLRKLELSVAHHELLIQECRRNEIGFLSTAFDFESFDMLIEMGVKQVKIP